jgi:hypothetical protein
MNLRVNVIVAHESSPYGKNCPASANCCSRATDCSFTKLVTRLSIYSPIRLQVKDKLGSAETALRSCDCIKVWLVRLRVSSGQDIIAQLHMPSWLTILVSGIAVYWLANEARVERAKRDGEITLYRLGLGLRVLIVLAVPTMLYGAGAVAFSRNFSRDWWVSASLLALAVFFISQWPSDLGVSSVGIYEEKWFGLSKRTFRWEEIASAMANASEDSIWIVSKSGVTIKHSKYHVDRNGLIAQLKKYCNWLESGRTLEYPRGDFAGRSDILYTDKSRQPAFCDCAAYRELPCFLVAFGPRLPHILERPYTTRGWRA